MSIIATALKHMLAAGMSAEAIIEAVAEMEANIGSMMSMEKPRSKAAIRTERYRANLRHKASQNVTGDDDVTKCDDEASLVTLGDDGAPLPAPSPSFPPPPQTNPTPTHPGGEDAPAHESGELAGLDLGDEDQPEKPKNGEKPAKAKWERPDWISETDWRDFEEMRRRISKPMSDRARNGIVNRLKELSDDGYPPGAVLEQSIVNCWQSVFKIKDQSNGSGNRHFEQGSGFVRPGSRAHEMDVAHRDLLSGELRLDE